MREFTVSPRRFEPTLCSFACAALPEQCAWCWLAALTVAGTVSVAADDEEEHEDEEEEDGEEEGMHTPGSRLRSGSMRIKPEPGAAVEEHSVPLTGGRGGRRGASRQPVQKQEPRDVPMGPSQQQQQHAQQGDGGAGPSRQQQDGDGPPGGTNDDDAGPSRRTRAGARQMRMSTMQARGARGSEPALRSSCNRPPAVAVVVGGLQCARLPVAAFFPAAAVPQCTVQECRRLALSLSCRQPNRSLGNLH